MCDFVCESEVVFVMFYNIFGSQDDLIVEVIVEVFVEWIQNLVLVEMFDFIEIMLEWFKFSYVEIFCVFVYVKKMFGVYFSLEINLVICEILYLYFGN